MSVAASLDFQHSRGSGKRLGVEGHSRVHSEFEIGLCGKQENEHGRGGLLLKRFCVKVSSVFLKLRRLS